MTASETWDPDAPAFSDDELTALALSADPDYEVAEDAVSLWDLASSGPEELLPPWYMPAAMRGAGLLYGWRRRVVLLVIISFVLIDAAGLCSTYGWVGFG
jgi:hypothetical protein